MKNTNTDVSIPVTTNQHRYRHEQTSLLPGAWYIHVPSGSPAAETISHQWLPLRPNKITFKSQAWIRTWLWSWYIFKLEVDWTTCFNQVLTTVLILALKIPQKIQRIPCWASASTWIYAPIRYHVSTRWNCKYLFREITSSLLYSHWQVLFVDW